MSTVTKLVRAVAACLLVLLPISASGQTQITGRIAGTVKDGQGAVIAGAEVTIENPATADKHSLTTDNSGSYSILQLSPGYYDVNIHARGFTPAVFHAVAVGLGETTAINVTLQIAQGSVEVTVNDAPPPVRSAAGKQLSPDSNRQLGQCHRN